MFGMEFVLTLILIRIVLPIGFMLMLGEWVSQRKTRYWFR